MRLILIAVVALLAWTSLVEARTGAVRTASAAQSVGSRQDVSSPLKHVRGKLAAEEAAPPPAPAPSPDAGYTGSVYSMYMGILIVFGIMWTIYFFLYSWQYDSMGSYSFFLSSFVVLVVLVSLGLSRYFTGSILTALLWSVIFITISGAGFLAMNSITSPDRFEGDKSNMGRTKLE